MNLLTAIDKIIYLCLPFFRRTDADAVMARTVF